MSTIYKCDRCGKEFWTEYYKGGLIDHENWTSDHNLNAGIKRDGIDGMIKILDMRDDHYCNIKDYNVSVQKDLINCTSIWLEQNKYIKEKEKMIEYFQNKEEFINKIFKKQPEFKEYFNYYVVDQNAIIDFYQENKLSIKEYKFVKIDDLSKSNIKYHIGVVINDKTIIIKSRN